MAQRGTTLRSGVIGATSPYRSSSFHSRSHAYGNCYGPLWDSWWDPCSFSSHSYSSHWSSSSWALRGGCGTFRWSFSLWYPWWHYRTSYWNHCYADSWWHTWSSPACASTSYWWYPASTYCPTYLYVPSTVVVIDRTATEPEPPTEPEPTIATASEVIVAGGGVVGSARTAEVPAGVGMREGVEPEALAAKYVELGDYYFKANRFKEALEVYAKARTYAPNDASVHFVLADAAFATGDYHFAAFLIGEGVRLDPAMASADTDKRLFYGDQKLFDEQLQSLAVYLESKPYDAQALLVAAYNLRFSAQPAAAMAKFQRVLEIAPDNRAAAVFLTALMPKSADAPVVR